MKLLATLTALVSLLLAVPASAHTSTLTDDYRAVEGISALGHSPGLHDYAQAHAERMAQAGRIWHSDLERSYLKCWQALGENVGRGPSVRAIFNAYLNSPDHRHVLLHERWDERGLGVAYDDRGVVYVAVVFRDRC